MNLQLAHWDLVHEMNSAKAHHDSPARANLKGGRVRDDLLD